MSRKAPRGRIRARIIRIGFVSRALEDKADLSMFRERPSPRLLAGMVAIALSYIIGWPSMTTLTVVLVWLGHPLWAVGGAPVLYALSWGVWGIGMMLLGPDTAKYAHAFSRWAIRRLAERFLLDK